MKTECTTSKIGLQALGKRSVEVDFDCGRITSDGGAVVLREIEDTFHVLEKFAQCFTDHRDQSKTEHRVHHLIVQRVMGLCLSYEDVIDHDELRSDPMFALLAGKEDPMGKERKRERDKGNALAGKSTLNRMELTREDADPENHRYKKILARWDKIRPVFVRCFTQYYTDEEGPLILDLDGSDDPLHGDQMGKFFHGYYDHYCYFPLFVFCGKHLLSARLRRSNIGDAEGAVDELKMIIPILRERWPERRIIVRGDSGFSNEELMKWCEQNQLKYVFGLSRNPRLERAVATEMDEAKALYEETGLPARVYSDFGYKTLKSWSRTRRVVGKAEYLSKGTNHRFVVTNLLKKYKEAGDLYENTYCPRGDMENRIKEHQVQLFSTRTSTHRMESNQLRLWWSSMAYTLMNLLREYGLKNTQLSSAYVSTIRDKILKIGARVKVSTRRVKISCSSSFPFKDLFCRVVENIRRIALPPPVPRSRAAPI